MINIVTGGDGSMMRLNGKVMVSEGGQWREATAEEIATYEQRRAQYRAGREQRRAEGSAGPDIVIGDVAGGNVTKTTINIRITGK